MATERKMSPKGFIKRATTAKSAIAFMQQYRTYMTTGELASILSPIVAKVDAGFLLPTPALTEIAHAVLTHVIARDVAKAETAMAKAQQSETSENWMVQILDSKGQVCVRLKDNGEEEDLERGFEKASDAARWTDRRLEQGMPDWHGEITHTPTNRVEIILRADAMSRILRAKKGPVTPRKSQSTQTLGFRTHVKQSRVTFSRG